MKKGMIKVSALYPNDKGKQFDMNYYCNTHLPMVLGLLGDAVKSGRRTRRCGRHPRQPGWLPHYGPFVL
jgi:hypothetical protein